MSQSTSSILVVDDDPTFRQGLRASLKTSGYDVDVARNAEQALEYVRQRPVDVVLLDINMPGIGGVEACRRIRAAAPLAGILMLTVRDAEDDKVLALEAGADDYVTKPFRLRELIARLHAVLRRTGIEGRAQTPVLRAGKLGQLYS
jgi:two-component system, OmpR family, KDP operon response regulator KdpE